MACEDLAVTDTPARNADDFRNILALFLITAFVSALPLLIFKNIPDTNKEIIVYMVGQLSGMATTTLAFYFTQKAGQDAIDAKRAETTGKMADAITAAASGGQGVDASKAADAVADAATAKADEIKGDGLGAPASAA
jgi:hypothetical protein